MSDPRVGDQVDELTPELKSFRRLLRMFAFLSIPGILMLAWTAFIAETPTVSHVILGYSLLAPGFLGFGYLSIFKRDLIADNKEYTRQQRLSMDPRLRGKQYTRNLLIIGVFGLVIMFYGVFTLDSSSSFLYYLLGLVILVFVLFGILAVAVANYAVAKGRSWVAFFWLSILISPLLTWLILASVKSDTVLKDDNQNSQLSDELINLNNLFQSGVIDEDEYKKAKGKILD